MEIARRFLDRSDSLSEADVAEQLARLTEEVGQLSANVAESSPFGSIGHADRLKPSQVAQRVEKLRGYDVLHAFERCRENADGSMYTISLQIALQVGLNSRLAEIIGAWQFGPATSRDWEAVYAKVSLTEDVTVARRWRTITRRSLRLPQQDRLRAREDISRTLSEVLAGVKSVADGETYFTEAVLQSCGERLRLLADLAMDLNEGVGFGVSSEDLEVYVLPSGQQFDEQSMSDYWSTPGSRRGKGSEQGQDYVAGTCSLGLRRKPSKDVGGGGDAGLILLKPKVVLRSTLEEL